MMNIAVVGTGYVGTVSAVGLASVGHNVVTVDLRKEVVDLINQGDPHIYEPGLPELLAKAMATGNFRATTDLADALQDADVALIAVGTPSEEGAIDLSQIRAVSRQIGELLRHRREHLSVVVKSTVLPGTTDTVVKSEIESASGKGAESFGLGMNPEFLREGCAVSDFMNPDRIVLGADDEQTRERLREMYKPWNVDKLEMSTRTAEMVKYANNCLLATQISAINELATVALRVGGIDFRDVVKGVTSDQRWSPIQPDGSRISPQILTYLVPGPGFGGSCFPKDVQAMRSFGKAQGLPMGLLQSVLDINASQPGEAAHLIEQSGKLGSDSRVLILGMAFKPDTDDLRESVSLKIAKAFVDAGATVLVHDPVALETAVAAVPGTRAAADWRQAVADVDAVVVATSWKEYGDLPQVLSDSGKSLRILDARGMFRAADFPGSDYTSFFGKV